MSGLVRHLRRAAWGLFVVGLFVACASETPPTVPERALETAADRPLLAPNGTDGAWADRPAALQFVLEQSYGAEREPDDAVLGNPAVLRYFGTEDGTVYAQDGQRSRLVKFLPDGTVAWVAGREGRGPGEFFAVTGLHLAPDGRHVVVSMFDGRLDYWSVDGGLIRSQSLAPELGIPGVLAGFVGELMVFRDGLVGPRRLGARVIVAHPEALNGAMEFEIDLAPGESARGRPLRVVPFEGGLANGSYASYEIRFYSVEGVLERTITRDVAYPVRPGFAMTTDGSRGRRYDFGEVRQPIPLPGGYFIVQVGWEEGVTDPDATAHARLNGLPGHEEGPWRASIDLFDPAGKFLQSLWSVGEVDRLGRAAYPSEIGILGHSVATEANETYVYALSPDPFPEISRYRLEFDPTGG